MKRLPANTSAPNAATAASRTKLSVPLSLYPSPFLLRLRQSSLSLTSTLRALAERRRASVSSQARAFSDPRSSRDSNTNACAAPESGTPKASASSYICSREEQKRRKSYSYASSASAQGLEANEAHREDCFQRDGRVGRRHRTSQRQEIRRSAERRLPKHRAPPTKPRPISASVSP